MELIDGKKIADEILAEVQERVANLNFRPVFCDILVGDDPVSEAYVRIKSRTAEKVGIEFRKAHFFADIAAADLKREIERLNREDRMAGLIVQLPLPAGLPRQEILDAVDPLIDVDCMSTENLRRFYDGGEGLLPPTAAAVLRLVEGLPLDLPSRRIVVLGQGSLVGKPVSFLLRSLGYSVVTADKRTPEVPELLRTADIIISATGQDKLLAGDQIKPGAAVIDAGTSESEGNIVGDVDFDSVAPVAGFLTPVPGGVGPVTVAQLLSNVAQVAAIKQNL